MIDLKSLPEEAVSIIVERVKDELKARYFYEVSYSWSLSNGYENIAIYFEGQAKEENEHYQKWIKFLSDWNVKIVFPKIDPPAKNFGSLMDVLTEMYVMEYGLGEKYKKDAASMFNIDQNVYAIIMEFVGIQNKSIIECNNYVTKAYKYLPSDPNLVLYEQNTFEN